MCWKILLKAWVDKLTVLKLWIINIILPTDRPDIILPTAHLTKTEVSKSAQTKRHFYVLFKPPTTYPTTHRPTIINLGWNIGPGSGHALHSIILEHFTYYIFNPILYNNLIFWFSEVCVCLHRYNEILASLKLVTIKYSELNEKLDDSYKKIGFSSDRSKHWRCPMKKTVLKNFAIFTLNTCVGVSF